MKMNPEVKAKWVAALRSGEYKQGHEVLKSKGNCFCCLGVLVDLYAKDKDVEFADVHYDRFDELPSPAVCEWAGLEENNPVVNIDSANIAVSQHNDGDYGEVRTFAQIADAIEAQL